MCIHKWWWSFLFVQSSKIRKVCMKLGEVVFLSMEQNIYFPHICDIFTGASFLQTMWKLPFLLQFIFIFRALWASSKNLTLFFNQNSRSLREQWLWFIIFTYGTIRMCVYIYVQHLCNHDLILCKNIYKMSLFIFLWYATFCVTILQKLCLARTWNIFGTDSVNYCWCCYYLATGTSN